MAISVADLKLEKERAASVAYHSFVLLITASPDSLFCFFENKDAPYYHMRIKNHYGGKYEYISCGNKGLVIKAYDLIKVHKEYSKYKLAFFIDRDFDFSIKYDFVEIYETPSYSIENLFCSVNSIDEFIRTDFQIGADQNLHKQILDLYTKLLSNFLDASLLFNAWYKLQKMKSKALNITCTVSLTNSLIPNFIDFTLSDVTVKYDLAYITGKYPDSIAVTQEELDECINEFRKSDLRLVLRGKYVFSFMTSFIRKLVEDSTNENTKMIMSKRVKYNMDNSTALSLLTTYAETPVCLREFLNAYV